jgi:teichuronic acid biosynthesis protein TuaE
LFDAYMERSPSPGRTLLYLTSAGWLLGPTIALKVGSFHLFPFRILLPALILCFLGGALQRAKSNFAGHVANYLTFLGFWLSYAGMSIFWAADKSLALNDVLLLFAGISVTFLTVYYVKNPGHLEKLRDIWIAGLVFMLLVALWEINTGQHLPFSSYVDPISSADQNRPSAVFYNTNDLAFFIALCSPFVYIRMLATKDRVRKVMGLILLLAALFVLAKTTSRAAQMGLLAALAFDFVVLRRNRGKVKLLATAGSLALALVLLFPQQVSDVTETLGLKFAELPREFMQGSSRLAVAQGVPELLITSYGMGVGAGNSDYYLHINKVDLVTGFTALHCWWLEILANFGIIVFVGYLGFFLALFFALFRAYGRGQDGSSKQLCQATLMGMVAFPIASFASSSIMALPQNWMFIGFALALLNRLRLTRVALRRSRSTQITGAQV